jgi:hypothetical protein
MLRRCDSALAYALEGYHFKMFARLKARHAVGHKMGQQFDRGVVGDQITAVSWHRQLKITLRRLVSEANMALVIYLGLG